MTERLKTLWKTNITKILLLIVLVIAAAFIYQFIAVNMKYFSYAMSLRAPKLVVMLLVGFCIGGATIVFQSIINNRIVTPCLLGMNSLYILIHTGIVFVLGASSVMVTTKLFSFSLDLIIMSVAAMIIYGVLFQKAQGNVLYVLLAGTVMATLFTSIATTLQHVMDPNEYSILQNSLLASFNRVNTDILIFSIIVVLGIIFVLRKDLKVLNVITLGKDQAINLGVDYDPVIRRLLIGVALFIAIATALVGPISFLGLIIANIARQLFKTYKHSYLIFGSAFLGMIVLLVGQALIEHVFGFSANISSFINIGGGAYFLYLLLTNKGH